MIQRMMLALLIFSQLDTMCLTNVALKEKRNKLEVEIKNFDKLPPYCGFINTQSLYNAHVRFKPSSSFTYDTIGIMIECRLERFPLSTDSVYKVELEEYALDSSQYYYDFRGLEKEVNNYPVFRVISMEVLR